MSENKIKFLLTETGALKKGHFLLASGMHSEFYFQAQALLQHPEKAAKAATEMGEKWQNNKIDTVVSLAVGGIVLGQEVARHLNARHIFVERKNKNFVFKRGFNLEKKEKVLVVEDVVTTGGSVKEALEVIEGYNADIVGIACLLLRGRTDFNYPFKSLMEVNWPAYKSETCPLCAKGLDINVPGTKQT